LLSFLLGLIPAPAGGLRLSTQMERQAKADGLRSLHFSCWRMCAV
jgi:hypothetical protein